MVALRDELLDNCYAIEGTSNERVWSRQQPRPDCWWPVCWSPRRPVRRRIRTRPARRSPAPACKAGQVKHVWLIILENKSYDATFTGLNQNSYLWKTLPSQGVLLKNYYGTGHSSQDNYLSMVSGPGAGGGHPVRLQRRGLRLRHQREHRHQTGANKGQVASLANAAQPSGANAPNGANGCTYPTDAPTLFNQLDAAGKTWKGYAQDLGDQAGREDAVCGGPGTAANNPTTNPTFMSATAAHPFPPGVTSFTGAQANDQYVAKHFPFPWFHASPARSTPTAPRRPA